MTADCRRLTRDRLVFLGCRAVLAAWVASVLTGCADVNRKTTAADERREDAKNADAAAAAPTPRILPETYIAAGKMLESKGDFQGAIGQYERAVAAAPRNGAAYNRIGIAYTRMGHYTEAEEAFNHGIDAEPAAAFLRNNIGYCCLLHGRADEAERHFRAALSLKADFQRARMNLATVLARSGRIDEGLTEFGMVVPPDVAAFNVGVLCVDQKRYTEAEKCFSRALEINPDCPGVREHLQQLKRYAQGKTWPNAPGAKPVTPVAERAGGRPLVPLAGTAEDEGAKRP